MTSLNPLAEAMISGTANTEEAFRKVATLKPGKTWADVQEAWESAEVGFTYEQMVAKRATALGIVVESTTLPDDGF